MPEAVLIYGDSFRSADMRHAVPLGVPDPFLYAEENGTRHVFASSMEAARLDETLASLAEGVRVVSVLLHPYMPASTTRLLKAIGDSTVEYSAAWFAPRGPGARVAGLEPLFPKRS